MLPNRAEIEDAAALIGRTLKPTAEIVWPLLSARAGREVWVKHENHTPIGAFKVRGGLVYMDALKRRDPDCPGVVTATRGNHGQSIAFAARAAGIAATVVVPLGNSVEKNRAMRAYGAELVEHGHDFTAAYAHALALADERALHLVPSFDPLLIRGVATYSYELMSTAPDLDTVYVPIGLGSGISGMIAARDALGRRCDIVGVVAERAAAYALSFKAGRAVATNSADTLADGMAVREPNAEAVAIIRAGAARVVTVTDDEILAAMSHYFSDTHNIAEGAGAAPLAALLKERDAMRGRKVGLVLSGGNLDRALYLRALGAAE